LRAKTNPIQHQTKCGTSYSNFPSSNETKRICEEVRKKKTLPNENSKYVAHYTLRFIFHIHQMSIFSKCVHVNDRFLSYPHKQFFIIIHTHILWRFYHAVTVGAIGTSKGTQQKKNECLLVVAGQRSNNGFALSESRQLLCNDSIHTFQQWRRR
jgi:hypothetical protein